jgi:hypothetical protein
MWRVQGANPFESGWVVAVTVYPNLATAIVTEQYAEAKRTGRPLANRQIHPYRRTIVVHRIREDDQTIVY